MKMIRLFSLSILFFSSPVWAVSLRDLSDIGQGFAFSLLLFGTYFTLFVAIVLVTSSVIAMIRFWNVVGYRKTAFVRAALGGALASVACGCMFIFKFLPSFVNYTEQLAVLGIR